jgi:integrase
MVGGIYSDQRCPICNGKFAEDHKREGLFCQKHPEQRAHGRFRVRFGRQILKRFPSYDAARRFRGGLQFEVDAGKFDVRDYQQDRPLGFGNLYDQYLTHKRKIISHKHWNNLRNYGGRAVKAWGNRNIKEIGYAEIEDFLWAQDVSDTTKAKMRSVLHDFWHWLRKRRVITHQQVPDFPEISFELAFRKLVDKETQGSILDEIHRLSYDINPKIWLGVKWLSTYISIRPGELLAITEDQIDREQGVLFVTTTKEKRPKIVPLIDEDIEIAGQFPQGLPGIRFFRHVPGLSGIQAGAPFGPRYLYKWWKRACANLGIVGVDLYGGTRHSTACALTEFCSPEEIKHATMHTTNKAFERYFRMEKSKLRSIYQHTQRQEKGGTRVAHQNGSTPVSVCHRKSLISKKSGVPE